MTETRKEYEERLLTELLEEIKVEPLCNILMYAASYLRGEKSTVIRRVDREKADILDRYACLLEKRIREVRR